MDYDDLKLKNGIEIREFDTSNEETEYLLSYNNKYWKISQYMHDIIMLIDGKRSLKEIAFKMSEKLETEVTEENIKNAVDKFPAARGLIEGTEDSSNVKSIGIGRLLWMKIPILRPGFIKRLKFLSFMYRPFVLKIVSALILACIIFAAIDTKGSISNFRFGNVNYVYVMIIISMSTWIHEFGHSAACLRYNLIPSRIGFAFYFTFPVLYSDVSCSWQLKRRQRVLVDVGGIYFELIYLCLLFITGEIFKIDIFKFTAVIGFFAMQTNLNPIIKMDAYWVVSDLLGIPNLHAASTNFFKNTILKLFKVKTESTPIDDIPRKERFFFIAYSFFFNGFMYVMLFFLVKFGITLPNVIKNNFTNLLSMQHINSWNFVYSIFNYLFLLVTVLLVIRSMYFMLKALIVMIVDIVKGIINKNNVLEV